MHTLSKILAADGVTLTVTGDWRHFRGTLHCEGRTLTHNWSQHADNRNVPSAMSVLGPALRNAQTAEAADSYEDWASDFEPDPRRWMPRDVYEDWLVVAGNLRALLGDERYEGYAREIDRND